MKLQTKIQRLIEFLSNETSLDYVSEDYVKTMTEHSLENTGIPYVTVISPNGKKTDLLEYDGVLQFLRTSPDIQKHLQESEKTVKTPTPKQPKVYDIPDVNLSEVQEMIYNCLHVLFPSSSFVLKFGLTIRLQDVLQRYRDFSDNQELRKKDLSKFLIESGLFYRTPQGLFTYVNKVPLSELEVKTSPEFDLETDDENPSEYKSEDVDYTDLSDE